MIFDQFVHTLVPKSHWEGFGHITGAGSWLLLPPVGCMAHDLINWSLLHCAAVVRTLRHVDWSSVWWRWWLPKNAVSLLHPISRQTDCPFVGRTMVQEPFVQWSTLPATRRSCVARTVRTVTAATAINVSLHTGWPNFELLSAILATRRNSARHTTPLASVHMVQGNAVWYIVSVYCSSFFTVF